MCPGRSPPALFQAHYSTFTRATDLSDVPVTMLARRILLGLSCSKTGRRIVIGSAKYIDIIMAILACVEFAHLRQPAILETRAPRLWVRHVRGAEAFCNAREIHYRYSVNQARGVLLLEALE